jgi:hypothetical protein
VHELRQHYPLLGLLKLAALPRSTFYHRHNASLRVDKDAQLKTDIETIYARHKGRYGYRRITAAVRQMGKLVNHKLVQRLMGELGLKSLVRPKRYRSYKGEVGTTAANVLKRQFDSKRPNQKWVTDVTEFKVAGEKLYLSPVLDLYNGEIVAYQTARRPEFAMVSAMPLQPPPSTRYSVTWFCRRCRLACTAACCADEQRTLGVQQVEVAGGAAAVAQVGQVEALLFGRRHRTLGAQLLAEGGLAGQRIRHFAERRLDRLSRTGPRRCRGRPWRCPRPALVAARSRTAAGSPAARRSSRRSRS